MYVAVILCFYFIFKCRIPACCAWEKRRKRRDLWDMLRLEALTQWETHSAFPVMGSLFLLFSLIWNSLDGKYVFSSAFPWNDTVTTSELLEYARSMVWNHRSITQHLVDQPAHLLARADYDFSIKEIEAAASISSCHCAWIKQNNSTVMSLRAELFLWCQ